MAAVPRGSSIASHGWQATTLASRVSSRLRAWGGAAVPATRAVLRDARVLALHAADALVAPLHASGETVDLDLGPLPAGKSITVVFRATVDAPPVAAYANHATVTWTNSGTTDSNTVTTDGDRYDTTTAVISSLNPIDQGLSVTFTATVTSQETGFTPNGTVNFDFGDGTAVTPMSCAAAAGDTCTAALAHTFAAGGLYTVTAVYQGGTNHDASSGAVDQTVIACTANPVVTNSDDSGAGSLRDAVLNACGTPGNNLITFNTGSVVSPITLTTGELVPARNVTVQWTGATALEITRDAAWGDFRIFHVPSGRTVTLDKLKLTNGSLTGLSSRGGGIVNEGTLTFTNSTVSGNTVGGDGGGIANSAATAGTTASLTIQESTVSGTSRPRRRRAGERGRDSSSTVRDDRHQPDRPQRIRERRRHLQQRIGRDRRPDADECDDQHQHGERRHGRAVQRHRHRDNDGRHRDAERLEHGRLPIPISGRRQ